MFNTPIPDVESDVVDDVVGATPALRALAVAIALLMVSFLVVSRSTDAIRTPAATSEAAITAMDVRLSDDDGGSTFLDIDGLMPGDVIVECIAVTYDGGRATAPVSFTADVSGRLAAFLDVVVETGRGGSHAECDGFVPEATMFDGTLAVLGETSRDPMHVFDANRQDSRTFRFSVSLQDDARARAQATTAVFHWTTARR